MSFAETKNSRENLTKKATAYLLGFSYNGDLIDALKNNDNFKEGKDFEINKNTRIRIRRLEYQDENNSFFALFTFYDPDASIPVTPTLDKENNTEIVDLRHIENYDKRHIFIIIDSKNIYAISQIVATHHSASLNSIFKALSLEINVRDKIDKSTIQKIRSEKIKNIGVSVQTTAKDIDEIKVPSKMSLFKKEKDDAPFYGTLTLNYKDNISLVNEATDNIEMYIDELSNDFFIETRKGSIIKSSEIKTKKDYYTTPYGTKTIKDINAKEILEDFIKYVVQ
ncbi:hypothetical protein ISO42_04800 [Morganella morganii subsp. morganii]|uniref:hypothetical protein n=1 Tax=Morganella morganii TaxID=582 RepID=UPI001BDB4CE6|nr:hypothetical protein [Morganella morganii]MBT0332121.1 hypothetical protein [Morganella morganii subsp. morganii]MBT0511381.1 hypothetical protein [Morganella morganii subsp. morganii]